MHRRTFVSALLLMPGTVVLTGCGGTQSPTMPSINTILLFAALQRDGRKPSSVPFGTNGASRIVIDGDYNWIFRADGIVIYQGPDVNPPTLNVGNILVSATSTVTFGRS